MSIALIHVSISSPLLFKYLQSVVRLIPSCLAAAARFPLLEVTSILDHLADDLIQGAVFGRGSRGL